MDAQDHLAFLNGLHLKKLVRLHFLRVSGAAASRLCVPLDFGPVRRERGNPERYQFWDLEARPQHWLSLSALRIIRIEATDQDFSPAAIVTWSVTESPWTIPRDWGRVS